MPVQTIQHSISYWRLHVAASFVLFALTFIFSILWLSVGPGAILDFVGPLRYLCNMLALAFLITASDWGWRGWWPVLAGHVAARAIWMLAKLQHWEIAYPIELGIFSCVLAFYVYHYARKSGKRLIDYLKLGWIAASSTVGLLSFVHFDGRINFSSALALTTLLQAIVALQWLDRNRPTEIVADWDFDRERHSGVADHDRSSISFPQRS